MAQNSKDTSQYSLTPTKNWYLDLWVKRSVSNSDYDKILVIPPQFNLSLIHI